MRPDPREAKEARDFGLQPNDALAALAQIEDEEELFRWALEILPLRNRVSEDDRARLDAAFFRRAKGLGADPELPPSLPALPSSSVEDHVTSPDRRIDDETQASV
jgi:hypothetical protein